MRWATCRRIAYCYRRVGSTIWCLWINSFRLLLFANLHFLHNIAKIGKFISFQHCETLIHAFITSKLGYCKSILSGLSKNQTQRLQYVQNSAARLLTGTGKYDNMPVAEGINYKILLLTFKSILGMEPEYPRELLSVYNPGRRLRSSGNIFLLHRNIILNHTGEGPFHWVYSNLSWRNFSLSVFFINEIFIWLILHKLLYFSSLASPSRSSSEVCSRYPFFIT